MDRPDEDFHTPKKRRLTAGSPAHSPDNSLPDYSPCSDRPAHSQPRPYSPAASSGGRPLPAYSQRSPYSPAASSGGRPFCHSLHHFFASSQASTGCFGARQLRHISRSCGACQPAACHRGHINRSFGASQPGSGSCQEPTCSGTERWQTEKGSRRPQRSLCQEISLGKAPCVPKHCGSTGNPQGRPPQTLYQPGKGQWCCEVEDNHEMAG